MTHSNHRQGTPRDLNEDFIVLAFPGRHFEDLEARLAHFQDIGRRHYPINVPGVKTLHHLVYENKGKVVSCLRELASANLELSITVTGLLEQTADCIKAAGLSRHTVNQSLGIWGNTRRLPDFTTLEIATMCGHSRVAPKLVSAMAAQVAAGAKAPKDAGRLMGKLCLCNIFNELRAAHLVTTLAKNMNEGKAAGHAENAIVPSGKTDGVIIDQERCSGCFDCIPYCPVSAIGDSEKGTAAIDPDICYECGVCLQPGVCPVDAIVAKDLAWPRSLRGRFQNMHSPYRSNPVMAKTAQPLDTTGEGKAFSSYQLPTELTNDVTGAFKRGQIGIAVELGRPCLGVTFKDVQTITRVLTSHGMALPGTDPLSELVVDGKGNLRQDILAEKAGWVVLRLTVAETRAAAVLRALQQVASDVNTVFAMNLVSPVAPDGSIAGNAIAREIGVTPAPNGKTNVGLGRPLATI